ncbi:GSCOCG00012835001-RA-CDS [Cotesia congregata]|nr:GSCOCG00012835001-RA-CDS [Cotesia congregata]
MMSRDRARVKQRPADKTEEVVLPNVPDALWETQVIIQSHVHLIGTQAMNNCCGCEECNIPESTSNDEAAANPSRSCEFGGKQFVGLQGTLSSLVGKIRLWLAPGLIDSSE